MKNVMADILKRHVPNFSSQIQFTTQKLIEFRTGVKVPKHFHQSVGWSETFHWKLSSFKNSWNIRAFP